MDYQQNKQNTHFKTIIEEIMTFLAMDLNNSYHQALIATLFDLGAPKFKSCIAIKCRKKSICHQS